MTRVIRYQQISGALHKHTYDPKQLIITVYIVVPCSMWKMTLFWEFSHVLVHCAIVKNSKNGGDKNRIVYQFSSRITRVPSGSINKGKSIMLQMRIDVLPIDLFTRLAINIYSI